MSSSSVHTDTHDADSPHGESHLVHPSDMLYVKVALILAALTAIEVATYFWDFAGLFVPVLFGLMIVKFFVVIWFFMHLKFDDRLFRRVFIAGLLMAIGVYVVALTTFRVWEAGA